MAGTINLPQIGPVKKVYVYGAGGAVVAFVGYRYYQSRQSAAAADVTYTTPDVNNPDVSASGVIGGAASGNTQYSGSTTDDTDPNTINTNAQWVADAVSKLSQTGSAKYDSATVYQALGDFIAQRPLTNAEQDIVRAAIAASGNPPVGNLSIVPSTGDVTLPAPTGLKVTDSFTTYAHLQWNAVSNASHYNIYRSDTGLTPVGTASGTTATLSGLTPNKSYAVTVKAVSSLNKIGSTSSSVTVKTKAQTLSKPATPRVTAVQRTAATFTVAVPKGATGIAWFVDGVPHGTSNGGSYTATGLQTNHKYGVTARGTLATQAAGPESGRAYFTTKK